MSDFHDYRNQSKGLAKVRNRNKGIENFRNQAKRMHRKYKAINK